MSSTLPIPVQIPSLQLFPEHSHMSFPEPRAKSKSRITLGIVKNKNHKLRGEEQIDEEQWGA